MKIFSATFFEKKREIFYFQNPHLQKIFSKNENIRTFSLWKSKKSVFSKFRFFRLPIWFSMIFRDEHFSWHFRFFFENYFLALWLWSYLTPRLLGRFISKIEIFKISDFRKFRFWSKICEKFSSEFFFGEDISKDFS